MRFKVKTGTLHGNFVGQVGSLLEETPDGRWLVFDFGYGPLSRWFDKTIDDLELIEPIWKQYVKEGKDCWGHVPVDIVACTGYTIVDPAGDYYPNDKQVFCCRLADGSFGSIMLTPEAAYSLLTIGLLSFAKKHAPLYNYATDGDCPMCGRWCDCEVSHS